MDIIDGVINSLLDAIILVDGDLKIALINRAAEEMASKSSKDIIGRAFNNAFPGEQTLLPIIQRVLKTGRSFTGRDIEVDLGRKTFVDFTASPSLDSKGSVSGIVLNLREVLKGKGEGYDIALDSLSTVLGSIAHEIKNPLGGIKGASQILRHRVKDKEGVECVELILREVERLKGVLQELLDFSRRPTLSPLNIHEVIEEGLLLLKKEIKKHRIRLLRLYDPSLPLVKGDEAKLLQVFINIIKNAIEAMPSGGMLTFKTIPSEEYAYEGGRLKRWAIVSVSDEGTGISKDRLEQIFLPFYTDKIKGTGLGLSISKKIIRDHGGMIKVESEMGSGTTFKVYIPFL